jgi:hypothetical protein
MDYFMGCESTCRQEARLTLLSLEVYHSNQQSRVRIQKFSRTSSAVTFSTKESEERKKLYVYKFEVES